ncbi:hypothetical protein BABINDRAFT_72667 [Babjeviella inositovora NRRL Y-12698]|uniref:Uncharacterized protein n=1 Tax=Babjeviella inositovora NRRL Y-12698 TaxID=984486 RepID=A0A1E3QZE2_9ASCO|nr:uncharacterized protein BABINDRAFT_72667 [Babjeviella inositovora NRRL Y-12698]ODQ82457.1 hypothetical protein BABINDRAFT_72667 [Babjeviella inositovora NRRL Y-12698]
MMEKVRYSCNSFTSSPDSHTLIHFKRAAGCAVRTPDTRRTIEVQGQDQTALSPAKFLSYPC